MHAHLPCGLYRRVAYALLHLPLLHGAGGCCAAVLLRDQLSQHREHVSRGSRGGGVCVGICVYVYICERVSVCEKTIKCCLEEPLTELAEG